MDEFVHEKVPNSVVRGRQLGLALLLLKTSLEFVSTDIILSMVFDPLFCLPGQLVVTILIAVLSLVVIITLGFVVGLVMAYLLEWRKKKSVA